MGQCVSRMSFKPLPHQRNSRCSSGCNNKHHSLSLERRKRRKRKHDGNVSTRKTSVVAKELNFNRKKNICMDVEQSAASQVNIDRGESHSNTRNPSAYCVVIRSNEGEFSEENHPTARQGTRRITHFPVLDSAEEAHLGEKVLLKNEIEREEDNSSEKTGDGFCSFLVEDLELVKLRLAALQTKIRQAMQQQGNINLLHSQSRISTGIEESDDPESVELSQSVAAHPVTFFEQSLGTRMQPIDDTGLPQHQNQILHESHIAPRNLIKKRRRSDHAQKPTSSSDKNIYISRSRNDQEFEHPKHINYYALGRKLGTGGFGEVYLAEHCITGKQIALKCDLPGRNSVRHEFEIYQVLNQNYAGNFLEVMFMENVNGIEYLGMERAGPSVHDIANVFGYRLTPVSVCNIGIQVISRLQELHSFGLVHRDLKPDNILFKAGSLTQIFLVDFGLTQHFNSPKRDNGTFYGTHRFASSHADKHVRQVPADDLESLGYVILYLITGSLPWLHYERKEALFKIGVLKEHISPEYLCRQIPEMNQYFHIVKAIARHDVTETAYEVLRNTLQHISESIGNRRVANVVQNELSLDELFDEDPDNKLRNNPTYGS